MDPQQDGFKPTPVQSDAYPRPATQRVSVIPVKPGEAPVARPVFGAEDYSRLAGRSATDETPRLGTTLESEPVSGVELQPMAAASPAPTVSEPAVSPGSDRFSLFRLNRLALGVTAAVAVLILLVGAGTLFLTSRHSGNGQSNDQQADNYSAGSNLNLSKAQPNAQLLVGEAEQLTVNGQLRLSNTVVVRPTSRPSAPQTGQIYYDRATNQPYYYDGKEFVSLAPQGGVTALGGTTGAIGVAGGLVMSGGQLSLSSDVLQQLAAAAASGNPPLVAGSGIGINGGTISNLGVVTLGTGSPNLAVSSDGHGHYTIVDTSAGSTVNSVTGTANQINVSSATGNVHLSLPQDIAVTSAPVFGGLTVNGSGLIKTTSTAALQIQNGAGSSNLFVADTADGRIGIGTAGPGYRLDVQGGDINTSGVYRVNGAQISSANLSNDSNLAKLNGANVFTTANTFTGTVAIQGSNSLILGSASNVGSITFRDGSTANTATLQVAGALSGNETFNLPTGTGSQTICTVELGNCAGSGSGITGLGSLNHLAKFTGGQAIGDSNITDDGTVVTVSSGQVIQGVAGLTLGASGVNGQLVFQNGSNANTLTLQSGVTTGNLTLTLPTADGTDGQCLKTNGLGTLTFAACTGGAGGGVTSVNSLTGTINVVGTANQIDVSTAGSTITLSLPQNISTGSNATFRTITLNGAAATDNLIVANAVSGATGNLINLQVNGVSKFTVDPSGNINTVGLYEINGAQISSANLSDGSNLAKLNGTGPQIFTGNNEFTGTLLSQNAADSTTALQIQNAAGTSNLFDADTVNSRIGIGTISPGFTLDVNGDINTTGVYRVNGVAVCAASGCTPAGGSGNYIQNGTVPQTADFNITGSGTVGSFTGTGTALFKNASDSTTAFQVQNSYGSNLIVADTANSRVGINTGAVAPITNLSVYNGNPSTTQTEFTQNVVNAGINLMTDYVQDAYTGGLFWSTQNNSPTSPKAGIYTQLTNSGSKLLFGTSGSYTAGLTNTALTLGYNGEAIFRNGTNTSTGFQIQNASGAGIFTVNTGTGATLTSSLYVDALGSGGTTAVCWNGSLQISSCASTGSIGFWNRSGTTLQPASTGDNITTTGNISTTGNGTLTVGSVGGAASLTINGSLGSISTSTSGNNLNFSRAGSNYIEAVDPAGTLRFGAGSHSNNIVINTDGSVLLQDASGDSTVAFQVQNAASQPLFNIDSRNKIINVGGTVATVTVVVGVPPSGGGTVGTWGTTTPLPTAVYGAATVAYSGYMYQIGGYNGSTGVATTYSAPINGGGTLGSWTSTNPLPTTLYNATAVVNNGYVYVMGGYTGSSELATVYYAQLSNGTIGTWNTTTSLPSARQLSSSAVYNGYAYILGGSTSGAAVSSVNFAPINPNGTLGTWNTATSLPAARAGAATVINNGYIYELTGGTTPSCSPAGTNNTYYALLNADGTIGAWINGTGAPDSRYGANAVAWGSHLYLMGGTTTSGGCSPGFLYHDANINGDGSLGTWGGPSAVDQVFLATTVAYNGYMYMLGGTNNGAAAASSSVYYVSVSGSQGTPASQTVNPNDGNAVNFTQNGNTLFQDATDSAASFQIQNSSAMNLFTVDTLNNRVIIGTPSSTPTLLVLGTKNTLGDPACVSGGMYYNVSTNQAKVCLGGSWAAMGVPTVTSLPASPSDGDEVYYMVYVNGQLNSNTGYWHLRYNASTGYWDFLGGPALYSLDNTIHSTASAAYIGSTAYDYLPLNGDYDISFGSQLMYNNSAGLNQMQLGLFQNTTNLSTCYYISTSQYNSSSEECAYRLSGLTGASGSSKYVQAQYMSLNGQSSAFYPIFVKVTPVRVK